ncbi:MAG: hypothetical protein EAZ74_00425 [Alphaproteobacteria bacterium]|nr:MAG: hypothetical protein EAY76_02895 [Alphaproteobacteria bacterium]TAF16014.1 MAG: hypothetical protein EAZ74_00425 [Alphaproteobacteria bacterium]TAF76213.1 MAG: hypothetical protein EAZ52_04765 [Alphaproteobacteria bacterium]
MEISEFLEIYNALEQKYGENFRRLTALEQKNLIHYAKSVGVENLSSNVYAERQNFLPNI